MPTWGKVIVLHWYAQRHINAESLFWVSFSLFLCILPPSWVPPLFTYLAFACNFCNSAETWHWIVSKLQIENWWKQHKDLHRLSSGIIKLVCLEDRIRHYISVYLFHILFTPEKSIFLEIQNLEVFFFLIESFNSKEFVFLSSHDCWWTLPCLSLEQR